MAAGEPGRDDVRLALQNLQAWPEISRSPQLARFLDYIVERKLNGDAQAIKAYSIAVDVLGRPLDFDPQTDPIVRVQARRLRQLIEQYYAGPGLSDPVRISLPTGRYVPEFGFQDGAAAGEMGSPVAPEPEFVSTPRRKGHVTTSWFVLAVLAIGGLALAYAVATWEPRVEQAQASRALLQRPRVLVTEFQNLSGERTDTMVSSGLAVELVTDLDQFGTLDVAYGGDDSSAAPDSVDFVLSGIVRREGEALQYSAILTEAVTGSVVWNKMVSLPGEQAGSVLDDVSGELSRALGTLRGPLHARARSLLLTGRALAGGENAYLCRMTFEYFRETANAANAARALDCLDALPLRERNGGDALAARAVLLAEFGPDAGAGMVAVSSAETAIAQAIQTAPLSGFVWGQRAWLYDLAQQGTAAEAAYVSALQLNPANIDIMAGWARHLALGGDLDRAAGLSEAAMAAATDIPGWYMSVPTLLALRDSRDADAIAYARLYAEADRELGPVLAVIAGQRLGDMAVVNAYLARIMEAPAFRAEGVLTRLRQSIDDPGLIELIGLSLEGAGLPPSAMTQPF
ncbi:MAG: hypothetical protein KIT02_07650 [Devosia sp.]|uniref:hypothetical protein n=1 Tax=Devosia sp. TaxID=1871048 RepID=UPI0024CC589A|nr:hypothetical protein [Devosia sp.]UYO01066.1 MAG: hypothetical protein KIT02_07650 [Devosia sp.]